MTRNSQGVLMAVSGHTEGLFLRALQNKRHDTFAMIYVLIFGTRQARRNDEV